MKYVLLSLSILLGVLFTNTVFSQNSTTNKVSVEKKSDNTPIEYLKSSSKEYKDISKKIKEDGYSFITDDMNKQIEIMKRRNEVGYLSTVIKNGKEYLLIAGYKSGKLKIFFGY